MLGKEFGDGRYYSLQYRDGEFIKAADRDVENMLMRTFRQDIGKYVPGASAMDIYDAVCAFSTSVDLQNEAFRLSGAVLRGEMSITDMLENDGIAMAFWKEYAKDNRGSVVFDLRDILETSLSKIACGDLSDIIGSSASISISLEFIPHLMYNRT